MRGCGCGKATGKIRGQSARLKVLGVCKMRPVTVEDSYIARSVLYNILKSLHTFHGAVLMLLNRP